ncbi:MAG: hypothetical protein Q7U74_09700, partial [Saprospiraceae bacterium]|nr:hypothetical protein [Saprospiraceae bacterium]
QWYFNGVKWTGKTNATLSLTNVRFDHAGRYSVEVMNSFGSAISSASLLTVIPLKISVQPNNLEVFRDSIAAFGVTVEGVGPFYYQWRFSGTNLLDATNSTMTLTNVQFDKAGQYSVLVSNLHGSELSTPAELRVVPMPLKITSEPADQWYRRGDTSSYSVSVEGSNPYFYQWRLNGTNLPYETNGTLLITNTAWHHKGSYDVIVSSPFMYVTSQVAHLLDQQVLPFGVFNTGPRMFAPTDMLHVLDIASGANHGLALMADGTAITWRSIGGREVAQTIASNVVAIAAGGDNNVILLSNGAVWSGERDAVYNNNPIVGLSNIVAVAAGSGHFLALAENG